MRKFYSVPVVLGILFLCLFIGAASAELSSEDTYKTDTKTLSYFDGSKNTTAGILVSKYDSKDSDRDNSFLQVSYINTTGYKAIRISDAFNSKGAIAYIPVADCEKLFGTPPYGMYDKIYWPEKVTIKDVSYYQFKIPHFSEVDISDWHDEDYNNRIQVTVKADSVINTNATDVQVFLNLSKVDDYWDYRGDDDANDLLIYGPSNDGGVYGDYVTIPYDPAYYDSGNEVYSVIMKAPLLMGDTGDNSSKYATYCLYINGPTVDNSNTSAVWTNGFTVYHLASDGTDSGAVSGQVALNKASTPTFDTSGIIGGSYNAFASTKYLISAAKFNYLEVDDGASNYRTIVSIFKVGSYSSPSYQGILCSEVTLHGRGPQVGIYGGKLFANWTLSNKYYTYEYTTSDTDWQVLIMTLNGTTAKSYLGSTTGDSMSAGTANYDADGYLQLGTINNKENPFGGYIDEFWAFTDVKSDAWIQFVMNNLKSYDSVITVGTVEEQEPTPTNIPKFTNPSNMAELSTMRVTFTYTEKETATSYEIAFCDTPDGCVDPWVITGLSPTGSLVSYLANSEYWEAQIRAKYPGEDNYSDWGNSIQFSKTNIPELVSPANSSLEQVDVNILFEWTKVNEVTGYDIQAIKSVLEPENWNAPDEEWSSSYNYSEKELSNGVWWWRVRAKDAYVNGTWSDPFFFEIDIDEIPFLYSINSANFYGGDTVLYQFSGLLTDYYIDIYKVSQAGVRGDLITSKIIERDEANESSFEWVVPADADYSFETIVRSTGGRLFRHYAMPYPEKLTIWTEGIHRARITDGDYSGNAITVCIGDMVYTDRANLLHDPYDYQRALYTRGEDIALHYSIDDPANTEFEIVIKNMATGATVATLNSSDIYKWNYELGYANRNFIIISTDGSVPPTVDPYLASEFAFSGDNWNTLDIPKGAYDYIIRDTVDGNISSIGESVLLIGDSTSAEWSVTPSKSSLKEGAQQVWTIAIPTDEIWDAYNQMMFIDYSSGAAVYKLTGAYDGFAEYPPIWQASFTITYNVDWDESTAPVGRLVVRPNNLNFQDFDDPETYYPFIVDKSFTITPLPDTAGDIDDVLDGFGLNSELYKIIFSMAAIIAGIVIVGVMGLPVMVIGLVALMLYVVFLALGWIPLWTAILMAMAFVAVLYKMFFGGNGGEA